MQLVSFKAANIGYEIEFKIEDEAHLFRREFNYFLSGELADAIERLQNR